MEIRDSLNTNKRVGYGVGACILIIAIGLIAFQLSGRSPASVDDASAFYTDDNGKTFFKDDLLKVSPFDRNGKQAYLCEVYQCSDGKQFVGLMYRHNSIGRKAIEGMRQPDASLLSGLEVQGTEVKRAGAADSAWKPNTDPETTRGMIKCASGGPATVVVP